MRLSARPSVSQTLRANFLTGSIENLHLIKKQEKKKRKKRKKERKEKYTCSIFIEVASGLLSDYYYYYYFFISIS